MTYFRCNVDEINVRFQMKFPPHLSIKFMWKIRVHVSHNRSLISKPTLSLRWWNFPSSYL